MATLKKNRALCDSQLEEYPGTNPQFTHRHRRLGYIILGLASLAWLGLRSGTRPSRLAYPCQQAAAGTGLAFLAYIIALISSLRVYRYLRKRLKSEYIILSIFGIMLIVLSLAVVLTPSGPVRASPVLPVWTSPGAVSDVFAVTNVPTPTVSLDGGVIPESVPLAEALSDDGIDALVNLMDVQETYFYKTTQQPGGIVGSDDVVVIKVNNQWNCESYGANNRRSHTNIDAVKGLIYRIVQHPESFTGSVIITDNGQGAAKFDCSDHNNAEDSRQSYQDVADAFASQSYNVCVFNWDDIRRNFISEYSSGNVESGYVLLQDGTPGVNQLSYPKFEITCGSRFHQISMRYGLWNGATYDNNRLKMINFPIVKRHTTAGATLAIKNYLGFITTYNNEERFGDRNTMHGFFWGVWTDSDYGLLGRQLASIRRADLEIVDAIWVNPASQGQYVEEAVRDNILLASTDPFAIDYYTSAYVLVPHLASDPDRANKADARYHGGEFRRLLMTNENRARLKGMTNIIDLDDSLIVEDEQAQFNVFVADATMPPPVTLNLLSQPVSQVIHVGETAEYTLWLTGNGDAGTVTLSAQGTPVEASLAFEPNLVKPPATSTLTLTTTPAISPGIYTITVTAASAVATATTTVNLVVTTEAASFTLSVSPALCSIISSQVATYTALVNSPGSFSEAVNLSTAGLPAGINQVWSKNPVTVDDFSVLSLSVTSPSLSGIYGFSVVAATATQIDGQDLSLFVQGPCFLPIIVKNV